MTILGMQLTAHECATVADKASVAQATAVAAARLVRGRWQCQRCGQRAFAPLPAGGGYCTACVGMSRVELGAKLWRFPSGPAPLGGPLTWHGTLTAAQAAGAQAAIESFAAGRDHLFWAVTGAGKTEMLFPLIAASLAQQQRVAVVSPRIDVVLELAPRLQAAFIGTPVAVAYGGVPWPVRDAPLTVATTHQMLRYFQHFDLMIIDEVDAFPFSQTPMLAHACQQAVRGVTVYLSATPPRALQRAAARGAIGVSTLARRFHGAPLPVPVVWRAKLPHLPHALPPIVWRLLARVQASGRRCLLFVPDTRWVAPLAAQLQANGWTATGVHASDPARLAKVAAFRQGQYDCLVTTTILERGVTIPRCAVLVLAADNAQFNWAALVQMAGRAGRAAASPDDPVWFIAQHWSWAMVVARHEIRVMNAQPVTA
ncbi:helicase-related protein [Lacticaseibacillus daqingensis]|uniref:helicase-related protein n=1 Tax=Lacticaseibacillus daqingensis TaxID=2486014 RepID=UPI000F76DA59|nr:helicase-related protein [Lacticaseibacillus daqingensis]